MLSTAGVNDRWRLEPHGSSPRISQLSLVAYGANLLNCIFMSTLPL